MQSQFDETCPSAAVDADKVLDRRFRAFFDAMTCGVVIYSSTDGDRFVISAMNQAGGRISQVRPEEMVGREVREVFPGVVDMGLYEVFRRVWAGGQAEMLPTAFYRDDRLSSWYENRVCKISESEIIAIYDDITCRKQAEEALQKSESHFRNLFDTMHEGFALHELICDERGEPVDYRYLDINPAFEQLTGLRRETTIGRTVRELLPEVEEGWIQTFGRVALTGEPAERVDYVKNLDRYYRARAYSPQRGRFAVVFEEITAQKHAQQELEQREAQLRVLLDSSHAGIIQVDPTGRIMAANRRMAEMFGCTLEDLLGTGYSDHVHPDHRAMGDDRMRRLIRGEIDHVSYERHYLRVDGNDFWGYLSGGRHTDEAGKTLYLVGHVFDITDLKRAEEALREKERYLQTIIDASPECIKLLTRDGSLVMMNQAGLRMIGADSLEHVKGLHISSLVVERDRPSFEALTARVFSGESCIFVFEAVGLHGRSIWLETHAVPFRDERDEIVALLGLTRDISDRKEVEQELAVAHQKLQDSETIYRTLFEQSPDGIQLTDPLTLKPILFNSAIHRQLGYSREEYADLIVADYESSEDLAQIAARVESLRTIGNTTFESRYRKKDGTDIDVYVSLQMVSISGIPHILAIVRDISEKKRAELDLQNSETRFRTLIECSIDVTFVLDAAGTFQFISPAWETHFGYPPSVAIGKGFAPFVHPDDLEPCFRYLQHVLTTRQPATSPPYRVKTADGSWKPFIANGTAFTDSHDTLFYLGVAHDLSEQRKAEEERLALERQLLHAQKLESLGVLAGGIAHDFNNILTVIIGNADLAIMRLNPDSPALENLQRIENAAARAADLARQMLAYSGKGTFIVEPISLNRLVEEMGHMLTVSISKKAVLSYNLTHPLPVVEADATQIRQIIMNLVINASEAIGDDSGVIAISTGHMVCDRQALKELWLSDSLPAGEYVFLEVADSGCGMDEETVARIFDPFFTTKFTGRGLGMAAVLGIVRGHKGAIKVQSTLGKGSSFKVLLPAGNRQAGEAERAERPDAWLGSGIVLLVDDEEAVRSVGSEMLHELGFGVVTASDGLEALELFKARSDISIVILDLTMPSMGGDQCFHELRKLYPEVRVIMSTGFSEQEIDQKFAGMGLAGFIQKPYSLSTLREALRNIQQSGAVIR